MSAKWAVQSVVLLTTNLPFSKWTQVLPNARLCKALLDRITDRAHIIETGTDSYRFRRTLERHRRKEEQAIDHNEPQVTPSACRVMPVGDVPCQLRAIELDQVQVAEISCQ